MVLANRLRKRLFRIRAIPGRKGLRPYLLTAVDIDYGADFTAGLSTTVNIREFDGQVPKVRWLTSEERVVGNFADVTCRVGPITPREGSVGTLLSALLRAPDAGDIARFTLTGPEFPTRQNFTLREIRTDHAMHFTLTLERTA